MKYQAEILFLKNKLRLVKGTIRHIWQGLIGIICVGGVLLYQFFFVIAKAGYGTRVTESRYGRPESYVDSIVIVSPLTASVGEPAEDPFLISASRWLPMIRSSPDLLTSDCRDVSLDDR